MDKLEKVVVVPQGSLVVMGDGILMEDETIYIFSVTSRTQTVNEYAERGSYFYMSKGSAGGRS